MKQSCSETQHNPYKTDERRVEYRWHPFVGQKVVVIEQRTVKGCVFFHCRLLELPDHASIAIPAWMFERARCVLMKTTPSPAVSWSALETLRQLISDTVSPGKGGAHASSEISAIRGAVGAVSPAESSGSVGRSSGSNTRGATAVIDQASQRGLCVPAQAGNDPSKAGGE